MFGIGSRTFYALWHGIIFNFEARKDRDYFIDHSNGEAITITAKAAYDSGKMLKRVRIYASDRLGSNEDRKERIEKWYEDRR